MHAIGFLMANSLESKFIKETKAITNLNMVPEPINTLAKVLETQNLLIGPHLIIHSEYYKFCENYSGPIKLVGDPTINILFNIKTHKEFQLNSTTTKTNSSYKNTDTGRNISEDFQKKNLK
ncbi:hypothetical protein ACTFIZ_011448 [Dictyostelium cf. discoideum]